MSNLIPSISICVPSYNCEKYIGFAVESVLSQTFTDFELIVCDDGSTDNTLKIIKSYKDSRIKVFTNKENLGMEANWNKALKNTKGKFIKLLCNDDLLYPTCLEEQFKIFNNPLNKDIVLVSCKRDIVDSDGKVMFSRGLKLKGKILGFEAIKAAVRSGTNIIGEPTAVMFRSSLLESAGFFDQSIPYLIDLDYWSRLLLSGNAYIIPDSLCAFRISTVSASVTMAKSQSKDFSDLIERLALNSKYKLTVFDKKRGKIMAKINGLLRQLFYHFTLKNK